MDFLPQRLVDILCQEGAAVSKSEARRYIVLGRVKVDGVLVENVAASLDTEAQVEVGNKTSFKFTPKPLQGNL